MEAPKNPPRMWGIKDVAAYLDVPVMTLYQWRHDGYGPKSRKVGRWLRYDPMEVKAWFDNLEQAS
jgi:predicted DNA-binding transcriptional regulator AlpA